MAEAAGLVLGGVAITSLFTACIEILEYFENGRNWVCDLGMAFAKVNLMKVRLSQLQDDWLNTAVGGWHKKEWPGEKVSGFAGQAWEVATISQGLLGIDDVLRRTTEASRSLYIIIKAQEKQREVVRHRGQILLSTIGNRYPKI
ncbi:hypothetical protein HYQ44_018362 [Verticillium longisporum]|nr:hypothetical protein HYQ44_018362 [Verticillium longisporum]